MKEQSKTIKIKNYKRIRLMEYLTKREIIKKIAGYLEKKDEILFAYIFGSFITSDNYHDIDIAIYLKNNFNKMNLDKFPYGYESELISNLINEIKKPIDLIELNNAGLTIKQRIVNKGLIIVCKNERKRIAFENYVRKMYIDAENLRRIKRKYLKKKIENA